MFHDARARAVTLMAMIGFAACATAKKPEIPAQNEAPATPAAEMVAPVTLMLCGNDTISVKGALEDTLELRIQGETFVVHVVPAASGAKYQAGADTSTFFWSHGAQASIKLRGVDLPVCEQVGAGQ
jgi:membrane-bound inhibitor of C-type lysozyme